MITLSIVFCLFFVSGSTEAPFTLFLSVDGDSFYPMEPIYTRLVIKNTSNTTQKIIDVRGPGSQIDYLTYTIVNENGDTMPGLGQYLYYFGSVVQLKPGDSIIFETSLLDRYGKVKQKDYDGYDIALWFIPPGQYSVTVTYKARKDDEPKKDFWRGSVESNKVDFVVHLPEDLKKPFNDYAKIWTLVSSYKYRNVVIEKIEARNLAEELINNYLATYKDTPYHPDIYLCLASIYTRRAYSENKPEYWEKSIVVMKELFEKYPESKLAQHKLADFGSIMKNRNRQNEWLSYLNYLIGKYPETRVGYEAKKLLEEERKLQK